MASTPKRVADAPVVCSVLGDTTGARRDVKVALERQASGLVLTVTGAATGAAPLVACAPVQPEQLWQAGPTTYLLRSTITPGEDGPTYILEAQGPAAATAMQRLAAAVKGSSTSASGGSGSASRFEAKTDKGSAELYFHY